MSDDGPAPRTPPHDLGAEEALLGAALLAPAAAAVAAALPRGDWYKPAHQHIAEAIGDLIDAGDPIDAVTVASHLRTTGQLAAIGGPATLVSLMAGAASTTAAPTYAATVARHAANRRLHAVLAEAAARAFAGGHDPADVVDYARAHLEATTTSLGSALLWADLPTILAGGIRPTIDTDILACDNGAHLLYGGKVHFLWGEPSSGKGWVAVTACAQVMALGGTAVYVDLEDTDEGIVGRLLALGVDPHVIVARFRLVRPTGPLGAGELADLEGAAAQANADLVIIDGLAEALSNDGADENDNIEVTRWLRKVPRRLAGTGAAVVLIDHVAKSKEERGRWGRGAGAKLAALDGVAYTLEVREPFSRDVAGRIDLIIAKDRHGAVGPTGATAAHFHIAPRAAGALVSTRLEAPTTDEKAGKPTSAMTHVSGAVAANPGISRSQMGKQHRGGFGASTIDRAIDALIGSGHIRATRKGNGYVLNAVRPYPDDDTDDRPGPNTEPPPPPPPPDEPLGDF